MSTPYNPNFDLHVDRGHGLHLQINRQPVPDSYGAIVMAELAHLWTSRRSRGCALLLYPAPGTGGHGPDDRGRARPQRDLGLTTANRSSSSCRLGPPPRPAARVCRWFSRRRQWQ